MSAAREGDADVIAVRPAIEHDNVTLVRNAQVRRLETDESGRTVTSVVADVDGHEQRFAADVVVVSAGAVNSARIGDADFDYPMGNLQMVGKSSVPMYRGEKPVETALAPTFALRDVAEHAVDFWLSTEDLPSPDNRVTLDRDGNVVLSYTPNNREPMEQLYHRTKKHLSRLGMHPHHLVPRNVYMKNDIPVAGCAHQAGTVRFGRDPATTVLDTECKAHEVDNLYVVDTSFFPSIGAVNPALTAMANALRVGDHLLERLA